MVHDATVIPTDHITPHPNRNPYLNPNLNVNPETRPTPALASALTLTVNLWPVGNTVVGIAVIYRSKYNDSLS